MRNHRGLFTEDGERKLRPLVVRALNVLRQYDEPAAAEAWTTLLAGLAPGGVLVEGTCDEIGRRAAWVQLDAGGPRTLTLAAHLPSLARPGDLLLTIGAGDVDSALPLIEERLR